MVLPPPTGEQDKALSQWVQGRSQVVSAAAGSGKSTLLLHAVRRAPANARVAILSYNRPLAVEMTSKLEALESSGLVGPGITAQAFTFHGLCSHLFSLTPDDTTMETILDAFDRGALRSTVEFRPTHVCIDEIQDMRLLHHRLMRAVLPAGCTYLLVGDANQLLYDFETPPATTLFMEQPQSFFGGVDGDWTSSRLSTSFRLTPPVAALVNAVSERDGLSILEAGNSTPSPPAPRVITCSVWQWTQKLVPLVLNALREADCPSQISIIARSVRVSQPLLALVNALATQNVPVYVHSCDGVDPRVREKKICVSTWHASKGLQWPYTFVLGVEASSEPRPLHVALTRSQRVLVIVNDSKAPHPGLLHAIQSVENVSIDAVTAQMIASPVARGKGAPGFGGGGSGPRDVTHFAPRGSAAHHLHGMIVDVGGLPAGASELQTQLVNLESVWEDVTDIVVDGALIEAERLRTGRCLRVEEMRTPMRASRAERLNLLMSGDRRRIVDTRLTERDLLPALSKYALQHFDHAQNPAPRVEQAVRAATGASAFAGYHHRANRLMASRWWSEDTVKLVLSMLLEVLHDEVAFDVVKARAAERAGDRPLYARVQACSGAASFRFVFTDRLTAAERLRTIVPMALDPRIEVCILANLRTGETQRLRLADRDAFLSALQDS